MSKKNNEINTVLTLVALALGVLFVVGLAYRPLLLLLLFSVAIVMFVGGIYFALRTLKTGKEASPAEEPYTASVEESIQGQLKLCKGEIDKNRKENREIKINIQDLESTLDHSTDLDSRNRKESKRILAGFYRELELRKAKIEFYETCKSKLDTLLNNYKWSKTLAAKQAKLNELKEDHHDDIAKMEAMRSDMAYNVRYLETIETLSLKMLESNSLDTAQQLQLELKEITKELRRL